MQILSGIFHHGLIVDDIEAAMAQIGQAAGYEWTEVRAFDPEGMDEAKKMLPSVTYCADAYDTMKGADAAVLLTEWNQFRNLDLPRMKTLLKAPILVDLRNVYTPADMKAAGFSYICIGRPAVTADAPPISVTHSSPKIVNGIETRLSSHRSA